MTANPFPSPVSPSAIQQHEVANPQCAAALYQALPAKPECLDPLAGKHIISIQSFGPEAMLELFRQAAGFESGALKSPCCVAPGAIMSSLFLDHTRPQIPLSFHHVWLKMGGSFIEIERTIQELMANRSDAYQEVAELCSISSDLSIVLTQQDGVLEEMLKYFTIPIINAGNGAGEHPTHALADLYTLFKWRPDLTAAQPAKPLQITIVGDPSYTRTIRSFLFGLAKFPQIVERIVVLDSIDVPFQPGQREALESAGLTIELAAQKYSRESQSGIYRKVLPDTDVLYVHELYAKSVRRMDLLEGKEALKSNAMILNPEIQVQEYANLINNSSHNGYFAQARGATFVRTALLAAIMRIR